jgi:hypothetical protein
VWSILVWDVLVWGILVWGILVWNLLISQNIKVLIEYDCSIMIT